LDLHIRREQQFSAILDKINTSAAESGVEIRSLNPKDEEKHGWYRTQVLEVFVRGGYHNIGRFVNTMEKIDQLVGVERLAFEADNMLGQGLKANIRFILYLTGGAADKAEEQQKQNSHETTTD
jgi:Tfp pilus assembly protein PilO